MPVTSFVAQVEFVWPPPKPPAPPPPKPAPAAARCKRKKPRRAKRHGVARLTPQVLTVLIDRMEAAIDDGRVELSDDDTAYESLDFTLGQLAMLYRILCPEEFDGPKRRAPKVTLTAPGSASRIDEYAKRRSDGKPLFAKGDVGAVHPRGSQIVVVERKNGTGLKVVGWSEGVVS